MSGASKKQRDQRAWLPVSVGLNAVIAAVTEDVPRVLTIESTDADGQPVAALPAGRLDPETDRSFERAVCAWVREQTGLELSYVEQLYTFGDKNRDPGESAGGARVISVAYVAFVREGRLSPASGAQWRDYYAFFPWEDRRAGVPRIVERDLVPALEAWAESIDETEVSGRRKERVAITFGLHGSHWDEERALERYELLYEAGMVAEALRDASLGSGGIAAATFFPRTEKASWSAGRAMALDHRRMLATALSRIRGKIKYRPVVFELLPPTFTLFQLQRVVEALAGIRLHKQNFRRLVDRGGLVERTGHFDVRTGGRPAEQFRFRREVLRERRAPGVGLPGSG